MLAGAMAELRDRRSRRCSQPMSARSSTKTRSRACSSTPSACRARAACSTSARCRPAPKTARFFAPRAFRDRFGRSARPRGVRADPARDSLAGRPARRGARRDRRDRLRADPRHPQPHRRHGKPCARPARRRQYLRQPQHDRRRRRGHSRSAASGSAAPAQKPAARAISTASPSSERCRSTPPRPAATSTLPVARRGRAIRRSIERRAARKARRIARCVCPCLAISATSAPIRYDC